MNKTIIFDEKSCQWSKNELVNAWTLGAYECRLNDHLQTRGLLIAERCIRSIRNTDN